MARSERTLGKTTDDDDSLKSSLFLICPYNLLFLVFRSSIDFSAFPFAPSPARVQDPYDGRDDPQANPQFLLLFMAYDLILERSQCGHLRGGSRRASKLSQYRGGGGACHDRLIAQIADVPRGTQ